MRSRSRFVAAIAIAVAIALTGCAPTPPAAPVTTDPPPGRDRSVTRLWRDHHGPVTDRAETVHVGRTSRRYTITVPPNHVPGTTEPIPLVLDFHGLIEGMVGTHPLATQFSAEARAHGFAVVDPIGSNSGFNWDVSPSEANPDLQFVDTLVRTLEDTMCIDRSHVYVTGLSYGAFMTSMLMCMRSNTFAAAAPVAGIRDVCTVTPRRVPFVTFHGTKDPILPYERFSGTPEAIATKYGCVDPPTVTTLQPDPDPTTKGPITRTTWDCTAVGSAAESYVIAGGGHSWPGSAFFGLVEPIVGRTATSIDATDIIWSFFARHHL